VKHRGEATVVNSPDPAPVRRTRPPENGLGNASLLIGIVSIPVGIVLIGGGLGLLAVVLGTLGRAKVKVGKATNPGIALSGVLCGGVGCLVAGAILVWVIVSTLSG
jgi:hypothetical protein